MEGNVHGFIVPFVCTLCSNWFRSVRWMISLLAIWSLVLLCAAPLAGSHLPRFFVPIFSFGADSPVNVSNTNRRTDIWIQTQTKHNSVLYRHFSLFSPHYVCAQMKKNNLELFTRYSRHAVNWYYSLWNRQQNWPEKFSFNVVVVNLLVDWSSKCTNHLKKNDKKRKKNTWSTFSAHGCDLFLFLRFFLCPTTWFRNGKFLFARLSMAYWMNCNI